MKNTLVLFLLFMGAVTYAQEVDELVSEPNKCYAKVLEKEPDFYKYFYRYTGDDILDTSVVFLDSIVNLGRQDFVKKKDNNCKSPNPEDCMVWTTVETPKEVIMFYQVLDTSIVKEYKLDSVFVHGKNKSSKWREVICDTDITNEFYERIQMALIEKGYDISDEKGVFRSTSKAALVQYQRVNKLPVGSLDIETLQSLGIDY